MPHHHPSENLLIEYVSGTLPFAQAVAIKAHLHFCTECQQSVQKMSSLAGCMLEKLEPQPMLTGSFEQLMNTIDNGSVKAEPNDVSTKNHLSGTG